MPNAPRSPEALVRFLNALPTNGELVSWLGDFRDALSEYLGDVDQVMVDVNYLCDLSQPQSYRPLKAVTQYFDGSGEAEVTIDPQVLEPGTAARLIRGSGLRLSYYHPPIVFEYMLGAHAYLGCVILLRERGNTPIGATTIAIMESIERFMVFLLSDVVARHNFTRPVDRAFHTALEQLGIDLDLTDREQEVLAAHLFGYPYRKIADQLHLSIDTVRKHVKAIHRKAGVSTYTELFAKYFTPRVFPSNITKAEPPTYRRRVAS